MDSISIHKASEKLKHKIDWIKPSETEWIYCGIKEELNLSIIEAEFEKFFTGNVFYIVNTRSTSLECDSKKLLSSIRDLIGISNFFVWTEAFEKVIEFNTIGVLRKGILNKMQKTSDSQ